MEASSMTITLISILGSVLICMISLLISMLFRIKKCLEQRTEKIYEEIKSIRQRLGEMLPIDDYREDKAKVDSKLDEHSQKILRLEMG